MTIGHWSTWGALRTFPQAAVSPHHEGKLQIGWLFDPLRPVYLDCWHMSEDKKHEPENLLYLIDEKGEKTLLTKGFSSAVVLGKSLSDFMHQ